ncbi:MAG: MvaI/BcnI restriction endonuclease family protein [Proteobacteria bacterium]|nr:MvaI/BcnI restriction endonuclease family protein [Pseudomonadota bacterium]
MKTYTKESLIKALIEIREMGWMPTGRKNNDGGVGNTLEDLLGIEENNLPLPNAAEWELKAQKKDTTSLITLFHMEPSPRAYKFVPSILLPEFGWQHQEAGGKYSDDEKSFRQTISAKGYSNRGFSVTVDKNNKKVSVDFNYKKIDVKSHTKWAKKLMNKKLKPQPYWGFDDLFHKAGTKLHNCFFVWAESKKINGKLHFHYQDVFMLKKLDIGRFVDAIETGDVYIDFDARTGHNHGTKFRLRREALINLYAEVKQY